MSKPATPPQAAVSEAAPDNFDPCSLLGAEEVNEAIGAQLTARLMLPTAEVGPECRYGTINRPEEVLLVPWTPPTKPPSATAAGQEAVPGLGRLARWGVDGRRGNLNVWPKDGPGFSLVVKSPVQDDAALRQTAVDLARKVLDRLQAPAPGRPSELPAAQPAPIEVCQVLPLPDQVRLLGWTPVTPPLGTPLEFSGGIGGGTWECSRYGMEAVLEIGLTKTPVPEQELAALGKPLAGLPRKAFFVDIPPLVADEAFQGGALLTTGADGRMLSLALYDRTGTAKRRAALIELARVVVPKLP